MQASKRAQHPVAFGANVRAEGSTAFSVHAPVAQVLSVVLDPAGKQPRELALHRTARGTWEGLVDDCPGGVAYAYRVDGELFLDPYARAYAGSPDWHESLHPELRKPGAAPALLGVVVEDGFDWGGDTRLHLPWEELVIYELHVKGFTRLMPDLPEHLRGTYAGLASDEAIGRLRDLGVTAVQLLPIHQHLNDAFLLDKGLTNYWGYNTLGYFAPHNAWAADPDPRGGLREFKGMVAALHAAGIEVILDVVYNHTAEGGEGGPSVSFRGLDNTGYYKHAGHDPNSYWDCTGCGNTFDVAHPRGLQLVLDSLRYWVEEVHIDGFRFDLAVSLARDPFAYQRHGTFFKAVAQDPVLRHVKLIAEPWDVGQMDSYQLGHFPQEWAELNGKYRDAVRQFWHGERGVAGDFASRLTGSQRLFAPSQRGPLAGINFITCHDGFTLRDLVSYQDKHNLANGEDNRDGSNHNHCCNHGAEGETDDPEIRALRLRQQRNFLATLLLSSGVPFLTAGDERNRTQGGNNNTYCHDSAVNWMDWEDDGPEAASLHAFVSRLLEFRRQHLCFSPGVFYTGERDPGTGLMDVRWIAPDCTPMTHDRWHAGTATAFGAIIARRRGEGLFLLLMNPLPEPIGFGLPGTQRTAWGDILDTALDDPFEVKDRSSYRGGGETMLGPHSLRLLELVAGSPRQGQVTRRASRSEGESC
jgi:glycogen operon protein